MIKVGCGIRLFVRFANGSRCPYSRTLLIIEVSEICISCLNVSGIDENKISKLSMASNKEIKKYNPPFLRPSMVKLDELYKIAVCDKLSIQLCQNGIPIDKDQLDWIINEFNQYKNDNKVTDVDMDDINIKRLNPVLR